MEPKTVLERRDQVQVLDVRKNDEWAEPAKQMMQRRKAGRDSGMETLRALNDGCPTSSTPRYEPTAASPPICCPPDRGAWNTPEGWGAVRWFG